MQEGGSEIRQVRFFFLGREVWCVCWPGVTCASAADTLSSLFWVRVACTASQCGILTSASARTRTTRLGAPARRLGVG